MWHTICVVTLLISVVVCSNPLTVEVLPFRTACFYLDYDQKSSQEHANENEIVAEWRVVRGGMLDINVKVI